MKIRTLKYIAIIAILPMMSCNDFLDTIPDSRIEIKTPKQMSELLVDGYSTGSIALMCELSSDNFIDNNSPDKDGNRYNLPSYERLDDEVYAWEDAKNGDQEDTPSSVWERCYHGIAAANHVLVKIEEFEKDGRGKEVTAQKGEALLIRAYNHFTLVNMFSKHFRGADLSKTDQGIPYVTEPEKTVQVHYDRISVAEVYEKIEKDLLEGLPLIDDGSYEVPKYHFNKKAANAFAARFFLYKRQYDLCEKYATAALGTGNEADYMRKTWSIDYTTITSLIYGYIDATSNNNFMLVGTNSAFQRRYNGKYRYAVNREAASATIYGSGPTWPGYNFHPCYFGKLYITGNQEYGVWFPKAGELFEYTDKVASIGYTHMVHCEFTAEETILCRAEARIYLGNIDGAVSDLKVWDDSRQKTISTYEFIPLTRKVIESYYGGSKDPGSGIVKPLNIDAVCPSDKYSVTKEMLPYLQCALHFRRIETIFDGYRWFDIKRYGIEITHKIGKDKVVKLSMDDPRKAFQIPAEVIAAGLVPTNRKISPKGDAPVMLNASLKTIK